MTFILGGRAHFLSYSLGLSPSHLCFSSFDSSSQDCGRRTQTTKHPVRFGKQATGVITGCSSHTLLRWPVEPSSSPPCLGRRLISSVPAAVLRPRARNTLRAKKHPPEAATHLSHPFERSLFGHQRFFKYEVCGQITSGIIIWRKSTTTVPRKEPLTRVQKDFSMSRSSLGNEERGDIPGPRTLDPKGTHRQRTVGKLLRLNYKSR